MGHAAFLVISYFFGWQFTVQGEHAVIESLSVLDPGQLGGAEI